MRYGFEYQAQPGSIFSPLLKSPVPADHQAIRVMHAISRELKDAYPSAYNDFGKLLGVISSAASGLAPMLGSFAPVASGVGIGAKLLQSVLPKSASRDKPAAATVEAVHERMQRGKAPIVVQEVIRERAPKARKQKKKKGLVALQRPGGLLKKGVKMSPAQVAALRKILG